jgi:uncharacterized protein (TIGR03118 family)
MATEFKWKYVVMSIAAVLLLLVSIPGGLSQTGMAKKNEYMITPLVSNNGVAGTVVDPNLANAWGLAAGPTSPWWVADNHADLSTVYNAAGTKLGLEVAVPGGPTGLVFNGDASAFHIGTASARFIFSTEGGMILGWAPGSTVATVMVDRSTVGAVYKGLAIAMSSFGPMLYATDFANGRVDVFSGSWTLVAAPGGFMDKKLPDNYAPFGIQTIGDRIFVTYGKQVPGSTDEAHGKGFGFVDAFDFYGNLLARVAKHDHLNAPWGIALAPESFGKFGGDLLIGNFGSGRINAYEEKPNGHFEYRGQLKMDNGKPIEIDGLWALEFGNGAPNNGPMDTLFFTAGPNDEADGLFGTISAA